MKVTLKLYASLGDFLPPSADRNTIDVDMPDGATVHEVLDKHHVPMETCHLILVNGIFTPLTSASAKRLEEGDTVAVWPPVAGG